MNRIKSPASCFFRELKRTTQPETAVLQTGSGRSRMYTRAYVYVRAPVLGDRPPGSTARGQQQSSTSTGAGVAQNKFFNTGKIRQVSTCGRGPSSAGQGQSVQVQASPQRHPGSCTFSCVMRLMPRPTNGHCLPTATHMVSKQEPFSCSSGRH